MKLSTRYEISSILQTFILKRTFLFQHQTIILIYFLTLINAQNKVFISDKNFDMQNGNLIMKALENVKKKIRF